MQLHQVSAFLIRAGWGSLPLVRLVFLCHTNLQSPCHRQKYHLVCYDNGQVVLRDSETLNDEWLLWACLKMGLDIQCIYIYMCIIYIYMYIYIYIYFTHIYNCTYKVIL